MTGRTIICDIGAASIKLGYAGSLVPEFVIPSVVGIDFSSKFRWFGHDAINTYQRGEKITLQYLIDEKGNPSDWVLFEGLLKYSFDQLVGVDCTKHKIVVVVRMKRDNLALCNLLFDRFKFQAIRMYEQSALTLFTQGLETGMVVDLGESEFRIVSVSKGQVVPRLTTTMPMSGRSIRNCGVDEIGLTDLILEIIDCCDDDSLIKNIVLSGGLSLSERFQVEFENGLLKQHKTSTVYAPEHREFLAFEGASLFADLVDCDWVSRIEFNAHGVKAVKKFGGMFE